MKKFILSLAVTSGFLATPHVGARTPAKMTAKSNLANATFAVTKMHCQGCAQGITQAATKWPGVKSANVSYEKKRAVISYDARKTNPAKLAKGFAKIGFPAKVSR